MINGLDIPSYNLKIGNGLYLTGTIKGKGCNEKRNVKKQNGKRLKILK